MQNCARVEQKVKDARETSPFFIESGLRIKIRWLVISIVDPIMKHTQHEYHYAVRGAKRSTTETIRTKLAENMTNSI